MVPNHSYNLNHLKNILLYMTLARRTIIYTFPKHSMDVKIYLYSDKSLQIKKSLTNTAQGISLHKLCLYLTLVAPTFLVQGYREAFR